MRNLRGVPTPAAPLGRARRRAHHTFDPALDDTELVSARAALAQGRWTAARALLATTGDDWDRRAHRVTVLAQTPAAVPWARDWQVAEPDSPAAALLLALARVHRALAGKERPERAREACRALAAAEPEDPTPGSACSCWNAPWAPRRTSSGSSTRSGCATATTTTPTT